MSKLTDDVLIDSRTANLIRLRIIKAERENEKTQDKDPAQMVKEIKKIIEEEVDQSCL